MKKHPALLVPVTALALFLTGAAGAQTPEAQTPAPETPAVATNDAAKPAKKLPKKAECAVCRTGPEAVKASYVYKGKTYYFCREGCKEEFQADPEKHIKAGAKGAEVGSENPQLARGSSAPS